VVKNTLREDDVGRSILNRNFTQITLKKSDFMASFAESLARDVYGRGDIYSEVSDFTESRFEENETRHPRTASRINHKGWFSRTFQEVETCEFAVLLS